MYGIRQCNRIFLSGEIGAFFTEIFFQISVVILNSNLHYQIFKFVIDNSDITSLNCLQHIQKRRNFDAKVTCHQPICLLLHGVEKKLGVHVMICLNMRFSTNAHWIEIIVTFPTSYIYIQLVNYRKYTPTSFNLRPIYTYNKLHFMLHIISKSLHVKQRVGLGQPLLTFHSV